MRMLPILVEEDFIKVSIDQSILANIITKVDIPWKKSKNNFWN